ncbi:MAG TPA: hypothetical protein VGJ14_13745 [Sporichthyaceae bacterium]|jgi:hypothetical protein
MWGQIGTGLAAVVLVGSFASGSSGAENDKQSQTSSPAVQSQVVAPEEMQPKTEPTPEETTEPQVAKEPEAKEQTTSEPTKEPAPKPKPKAKPKPKPKPKPAPSCDPNYSGACVPIAYDVDCAGGSGDGPAYVSGPVRVTGSDIYGLDRDGDGVGCD